MLYDNGYRLIKIVLLVSYFLVIIVVFVWIGIIGYKLIFFEIM